MRRTVGSGIGMSSSPFSSSSVFGRPGFLPLRFSGAAGASAAAAAMGITLLCLAGAAATAGRARHVL